MMASLHPPPYGEPGADCRKPKMIKIAMILGTRPEAIKLAPVIRELARHPRHFEPRVWVTGQHREMLDQVLSAFQIEPHVDLNIMSTNHNLAQVTSRVISGLHQTISTDRPDAVLVQGDTTTALCGALAAYYHKVRVGHVEAGLRTGNKYAPYPEEGNRRLISPLADFHFAPTQRAKEALLKENVDPTRIFVTGNTVIDALLWTRDRVNRQKPELPQGLVEAIEGTLLILVTGHRRENFGDGLHTICRAIRATVDAFPQVSVVYPVHLNPNVRQPVHAILGGHDRIHLIEPVAYPSFVWLMDRAGMILTDSGGIQEEAPSLGKPVLVTRQSTERPEAIETGGACLVGVKKATIEGALARLILQPQERGALTAFPNPFGDGKASGRIVRILKEQLSCLDGATSAGL